MKDYPSVSHALIYRYIVAHPELRLVRHLRRRGVRYRGRTVSSYNRTERAKHTIHERPTIVDTLTRHGDLEGDTIFGKDTRDRLLTHVDRVSGVASISLVYRYNATCIQKQTTQDIARVFRHPVHTITYDNGSEFSTWRHTERDTGATIYFADPYTSSQRGRIENLNGLIRDYLPKGTDFKKITHQDILDIETLLNNRPRKRFNGLTPIEVSQGVAVGV